MAISLRLPGRLTDEEILDLSARNPTGAETGRREVILLAQLHRWATEQGQGVVFGPSTGFRLPDGSLRSPDASWVRRDRWAALAPAQREGFAPLCPDAVFEIRSRRDSSSDLGEKMRTYLANCARLAVLIDLQSRAVEIYGPSGSPKVQEQAEYLPLDPVLPGFTLDLRPIFE